MNELEIGIPNLEFPRYLLYTFLNFSLPYGLEWEVSEDEILVRSKSSDVIGPLVSTFKLVRGKIEKIEKNGKRAIPGSGNDNKIYSKIKKELSLTSDRSFSDVVSKYIEVIQGKNRLELEEFGKGKISAPSIFKLELYQFSRRPFMKGTDKLEFKLTLDYFMFLLGGYVLSKVGRAQYDIGRYLSVHLLPYDYGIGKSEYSAIINMLEEREIPGLVPEEALMMWLTKDVSEDPVDVMLAGIEDPAKTPASLRVSAHLPLRSFYQRSREGISIISENETLKKDLERILRHALRPPKKSEAIGIREEAIKISKKMFLALQGDMRSLEELLLETSRKEISAQMGGDEKLRSIMSGARRISSNLLVAYS
ncbi:MAG TPA: hypothetical protein ENF65_01025 [Euryarchaeota archaeon]|nr:hypothetical protein [Euryarchaeota archaeon]